MLLAEVFLLCYLMCEVREVQLYSERSDSWMLVSALAPSEKFYALALFEITLRMCFRYNAALSARIMGDFVNLAILMTNHVHSKVPFPYMAI